MSAPKKKDRLFLFPALIVWILILVTSVGNIRDPLFSSKSPMNVAGALIFIIGLAIRLSAAVSLNRSYSWTLEIRDEHRLVKDGLYRYVRHPVYLGALLSVIAVPIYAASFLGFLFTLTAIPLFIYRMGVEEKMLIEEYGDEYLEFMKATSKLIPHIY
jgi:protein-S-isoprenylcysteine O-methyltransferase Ste14